jgi:transposase
VIQINLSTDEITLLQKYTHSPVELIRFKALTVLARSQLVPFFTLTIMFDREIRSLERWVKDFSKRRMASIFSGMVNNEHASKLTRDQKEEIKKTLADPPSDYGLSKEFWDVPTLRSYMAITFGVAYESDQSYHFLLRFSRLSFKYPEKFDIHRNEQVIEKRIKEIRNEIAPYLKNPSWDVFAADETGLMLEALTRKAWIKKGEKTIIKTERSKQRQSYLGFLNLKTGKCQIYPIARGRQTYILSATKKHITKYPDQKICIVWDNGKFHKGKLIIEALRTGQPLERVHLIPFPPYAPDTNPIEHVWREGKKATANHQFKNFSETKHAFEKKISGKIFNYQI